MSADTLERLMNWLQAQADGDWEHGRGIRIETLDNPGWHLRVDLAGTPLESVPFTEVRDAYEHATDWMICRRVGTEFDAACGASRLTDALQVFLDWAKSSGL